MNRNIYVVRSESGPVKVGITRSPQVRLYWLQKASEAPLHVDFIMGAGMDAEALERRVHAVLAQERITGEWFRITSKEAVSAVLQAAEELGLQLTPARDYGPQRPVRRQTITVTDPQSGWLQVEAQRLGITVSDLIRRLIDEAREGKRK